MGPHSVLEAPAYSGTIAQWIAATSDVQETTSKMHLVHRPVFVHGRPAPFGALAAMPVA